MNKPRVQALLDHLKKTPEEAFYYAGYFKPIDRNDAITNQTNLIAEAIRNNEGPPCNTAGCVAGHCALLFWDDFCIQSKVDHFFSPDDFAAAFLGLYLPDADGLFMRYMQEATLQDAINRLEYLLEHSTLVGYNWSSESHVQKQGV